MNNGLRKFTALFLNASFSTKRKEVYRFQMECGLVQVSRKDAKGQRRKAFHNRFKNDSGQLLMQCRYALSRRLLRKLFAPFGFMAYSS